jgi:hypothetical protein
MSFVSFFILHPSHLLFAAPVPRVVGRVAIQRVVGHRRRSERFTRQFAIGR